ncbi:MAG: glycosyltransferase family 4 protein [Bacteroidales bacterium]|nr:glycosyltransferase family 4 protein [Bacteroidales bacterium]
MKTICMLSDMHPLFDDRIYWKEAVSLKKHGYNLIHIGFDKDCKDFMSPEGIRIITIKKRVFHRNIFLHKLIKTILFDNPHRTMMKKIVEVRADAYHIHDLKVNVLGEMIKKLPWKPKIIYDIHEDYGDMIRYYNQKKGFVKWLLFRYASIVERNEKRRTKNYDFYLTVLPEIKERFNKKNPHMQSEVIYNYTNLKPVSNTSKSLRKYELIYSGLINWCRGPLEIIDAIEIVKKTMPDIKMLFIGRFNSLEFEKYVKSKVRDKQLEENIEFQSEVPYEKVGELYNKSMIGMAVFHPIKVFYYSIQVKTFEYMLYGLPIVCSNFGYVNKFITESHCGIPVDPLKPEEIALAIIRLLTDSKLYQQMSRSGKQAAQTRYNWQSEEEKLITIYNKLLTVEP